MSLKISKYQTKGAIIGGLIGLVGSLLQSYFSTMNHDPFFLFGIPSLVLQIIGVGGCSWKSSFCPMSDFLGSIITISIFLLIGLLIGKTLEKVKK